MSRPDAMTFRGGARMLAVALAMLLAVTLAGCARSTIRATADDTAAAPASSGRLAAAQSPCLSGTCWVAVSVATMWVRPWYPRPVDAPALANPARPREWVAAMTLAQKQWLGGKLESQALYGTRVTVIDHHGADWTKIAVPGQPTDRDSRGYPGWVPTRQLTSTAPAAPATSAIVRTATAWLWTNWTSNGPSGSRLMEISYATALPVVTSTSTYVVVQLIGGRKVSLARWRVALHTAGTPWGATGAKIVAEAKKFLGLQYLWAGTSGFGFDCSGFTHSVYLAYGVTLPRDANRQAVHGTPVSRNSLRPGDLVFFREGATGPIGHVGIYAGGGMMIDAPHTGAPVRTESVWSFGNYAGARRYVPS
ncbi:MAG TPA: NlpC/P60 family protein [Streptosporangiaceae bacterium]